MRPIVNILGYAGLLPFVGLAIMSIVIQPQAFFLEALALYSFGIFAFLCGAWWPSQDIQQAKLWRIVLSNGFFLVAFFTYLFAPQLWLGLGAILLIILYLVEQYTELLPDQIKSYRRLRLVLTIVASISMLIGYISSGALHG